MCACFNERDFCAVSFWGGSDGKQIMMFRGITETQYDGFMQEVEAGVYYLISPTPFP